MGTTSDTYRRKKQISKEQQERFERLEELRKQREEERNKK